MTDPSRRERQLAAGQELDGDKIIRARRVMGLGVDELAAVLGVHRVTLYRWEADSPSRGDKQAPEHALWPRSPAVMLLRWLIELDELELDRIAGLIRKNLASPVECQFVLLARMRKASK